MYIEYIYNTDANTFLFVYKIFFLYAILIQNLLNANMIHDMTTDIQCWLSHDIENLQGSVGIKIENL